LQTQLNAQPFRMAELVRFVILPGFKSQCGSAVDLKRPNRKLVEVRGHLTLLTEAGMRSRFPKVGNWFLTRLAEMLQELRAGYYAESFPS
jgi:hypothetical protein